MENAESMSFWDEVYQDTLRSHELFHPGMPPAPRSRMLLNVMSPRLMPVFLYRCSYALGQSPLRVLSKVFSLVNYVLFGIEIAVDCKIGPGLFLPHTQGTVIGAYEIGRNATIYQGVTLGAKDLDFEFDPRHRPVVGDNVLIGAGAKILGGINIGSSVRIGANSVVLDSVPDHAVVAGIPAKVVKTSDGAS